MRIAIRGGHTPHCTGAVRIIKEQPCVWEFAERVAERLKKFGHEVLLCNPTTKSNDKYTEMAEAHKMAQNFGAEIFITIHMNASNGQGHGVEAWLYSNILGSLNSDIAYRMCWHMEQLGLSNRGVKVNSKFYDLHHTIMPAIILETLFCDNEHDVNIWNNTSWETLVGRIACAIDPNIPIEDKKPPESPVEPSNPICDEIHRVKVNGEQVGAYKNHDNVANAVKDNLGKGKIEIQ